MMPGKGLDPTSPCYCGGSVLRERAHLGIRCYSRVRKRGSILSVMSSLGSNQILQSLRPREHLSAQWRGSKKISSGLQAGVSLPRKCELSSVNFWQAPHVSGGSLMPRAWGLLAAEDRGAQPAVGGFKEALGGGRRGSWKWEERWLMVGLWAFPALTATLSPAPEQPARHHHLDAAGRQASGIPAAARTGGPLLPPGHQLLWQELWEAADHLSQSGFLFLKSWSYFLPGSSLPLSCLLLVSIALRVCRLSEGVAGFV